MSQETLGIINETLGKEYRKLYEVSQSGLTNVASSIGRTRFILTIDALARLPINYPTIHIPTLAEVAKQQQTELAKSRRRSMFGLAGALIRQGKINLSLLDKNGVISISPQQRKGIDPRLLHLNGLQLSKRTVSRLLARQTESEKNGSGLSLPVTGIGKEDEAPQVQVPELDEISPDLTPAPFLALPDQPKTQPAEPLPAVALSSAEPASTTIADITEDINSSLFHFGGLQPVEDQEDLLSQTPFLTDEQRGKINLLTSNPTVLELPDQPQKEPEGQPQTTVPLYSETTVVEEAVSKLGLQTESVSPVPTKPTNPLAHLGWFPLSFKHSGEPVVEVLSTNIVPDQLLKDLVPFKSNPISHREWFPIPLEGSKIPPSSYERTRVNTGALPLISNSIPDVDNKRRPWTVKMIDYLKDITHRFYKPEPENKMPAKTAPKKQLGALKHSNPLLS